MNYKEAIRKLSNLTERFIEDEWIIPDINITGRYETVLKDKGYFLSPIIVTFNNEDGQEEILETDDYYILQKRLRGINDILSRADFRFEVRTVYP